MKINLPLWHKLFFLAAFIVISGGAICFLIIFWLRDMLLPAFMLLFSNHMAHLILRVAKRDYIKEKAKGRGTHKGEIIFSGVDYLPYHLPEALVIRKEKWEKALKGTINYFNLEEIPENKEFKLLNKNNKTFLCFHEKKYAVDLANLSLAGSQKSQIWGWGLLGYYKTQPIYQFLFLEDNIFSYDSIVVPSEFPPDAGLVWQKLMYKLDGVIKLKEALEKITFFHHQ